MPKKDRQKDRSNWFCAVSNVPEQMDLIKQNCKNFKRWFYIEHEPDSEDGKRHLHLMVMYGGSCYIRTAASLLGIPENFVQFCTSHKAYAQYMIHLHEEEKIKYNASDVQTNYPGLFKSMIIDCVNDDIHILFEDMRSYRMGKITASDFIERHYSEFQSMPFYQKIKTIEYLEKNQSAPT